MPKKRTPTQPEPENELVIPEWVTGTPEETPTEYNLTMYDDGASVPEQDMALTREEFIDLKEHLAKMRGYTKENQSNAQSQ